MKHSFVHRTAGGLIVPFVIVIGVLLAGVGSAQAAKNALVEVGFVGVPPPNFQNVLLNVQSVRINPNVGATPYNGKWQSIPVPPGIGNAGQNADMQIDLNASQNLPQIFNTAGVQAGTYRLVELRLDPNNPGTLVPDCPQTSPPISNPNTTADGCINYPIQLTNGNNVIVYPNPDGLIFPANKIMTPLILQVSMSQPVAPTVPGGAYTVTITLTTPPANPLEVGTVTGSVNVNGSGSGTSPSGKVRKLAVTAEAIGTNTAIASTPVKNGQYTLILPAAPNFGTLYDLAVAGGADTYAAQRLLPLYQGTSITADFNDKNSLTGSQTLGNITGTISDNCVATKPIVGATLQLLIPPDPPNPNSSVDCSVPGNAPLCVAVATANTDNTGYFPLPGTITIPAEFQNVPIRSKSLPNTNKGAYVMEVTAPGYDPLFEYAIPTSNGKGGTCAPIGSTTFGACDLFLNTGYIQGKIQIQQPVPGQTILVQVFAEDAGTNNIESALPMPITVTSSNGGTIGYTLNVPPSVSTFDLFATTIDNYQGVGDPYPGHTIVVKSGVTGPAEPSKPGACSTATPTPFEQTIECIGHGSLTGAVYGANLGSSVVLSKQDPGSGDFVAITNALVQNQSPNSTPPPSNNYSFCAPADTYQVQEWQLPTPDADATPSSSPTASPVPDMAAIVMIPTPLPAGGASPTPTPAIKCPTTCENPDGTCPGICSNVIQPLPPTPTP
ncbi:MAG: hypothetical protein WCE23_01035 [Candidatus Binatus sp.]|uniref:DUF4382 domain-containing protein n=1 Tax=Candidatus Binatus sp. TaxID=2811406 RepID=UPI003C792A84